MKKRFRCVISAGWAHTSHFEHGQRKMWLSWVHFRLVWGLRGAPNIRSQMVDLGCEDTDWVGGNDEEVLDAIFLQDGFILFKAIIKAKTIVCNITLITYSLLFWKRGNSRAHFIGGGVIV